MKNKAEDITDNQKNWINDHYHYFDSEQRNSLEFIVFSIDKVPRSEWTRKYIGEN